LSDGQASLIRYIVDKLCIHSVRHIHVLQEAAQFTAADYDVLLVCSQVIVFESVVWGIRECDALSIVCYVAVL
jgi:hypothetical protein